MKDLTITLPDGTKDEIDSLVAPLMENGVFRSRTHFLTCLFLYLESMIENLGLWRAILSIPVHKTKYKQDVICVSLPDRGKERLDMLLEYLKTMGFKTKGELIQKSIRYFQPYRDEMYFWMEVANHDAEIRNYEPLEVNAVDTPPVAPPKSMSPIMKPVTRIVRL